MYSLIRNLFGRPESPSSFNHTAAPSTLQADTEAANRHQLALISVRDVWRRCGIPSDWIECQTLMVNSRRRGAGLYIQLVVHHWDERLLRYAGALQTEITSSAQRFDPKAAQWIHGISWQFPPVSNCPYATLPEKSTWQHAPESSHSSNADTSAPSAHFPAVVAASADGHHAPHFAATVSFQSTQPISRDDIAQDLERLFAIRDEELKQASTDSPHQVGFEKTEPSPLNR